MEALLVDELPVEEGWQFEPKWDGFRCIAIRDGDKIELWSKSGKPLGRYFPEIISMLARLNEREFVFDGELLIEVDGESAFDALQARLHPATSRITRLSIETPAQFIVFDCLSRQGRSLLSNPLHERRAALEALMAVEQEPALTLSPHSTDRREAAAWLERSGAALDGIIAKRLNDPYRSGERAMLKLKVRRSADCVIGGFRRERNGTGVASLLLGLYDSAGLLNHVGFTSSIAAGEREVWATELGAIAGSSGFTGKAPGGPSRWTSRSAEWQPVESKIVIEVLYDQVTGDRFRHGTRLIRRRPDKAPSQCTMDQLSHPLGPSEVAQLIRA